MLERFTKMVLVARAMMGLHAEEIAYLTRVEEGERLPVSNNATTRQLSTTWGNLTHFISPTVAMDDSTQAIFCDPDSYFEVIGKPGTYCPMKEATWTPRMGSEVDPVKAAHLNASCNTRLVPQPINATLQPIYIVPNPNRKCWDGPLPDHRYGRFLAVTSGEVVNGESMDMDIICFSALVVNLGNASCEALYEEFDEKTDRVLIVTVAFALAILTLCACGRIAQEKEERKRREGYAAQLQMREPLILNNDASVSQYSSGG